MIPFNPFSVLTSKIFAGASVALLVAVVVCWIGWTHAAEQRDTARAQVEAANAKLAVSNDTIAALQKSLSDYVGAGKAAKVAQLASVEAQAKDNAALQGQADAIRAEVAKLPAGKCETPKSVISARGL